MSFLYGNSVLVLGLGKSGIATVEFALRNNFKVIGVDSNINDFLVETKLSLESKGAKVFLNFLDDELPESDFIVISPGISENSSLGILARKTGKEIISEIDFASLFLKNKTIIGITGTNGKTTVTELSSHVLNTIGKRAIAAGNIGKPLIEVVQEQDKYDFIVVEISSFQLHFSRHFAPKLAIILNLDSDHIDWHGNFDSYVYDKFKIFQNCTDNDVLIMGENVCDILKKHRIKVNAIQKTVSVCSESSNYHLENENIVINKEVVGKVTELNQLSKTQHNIENAIFVIGLCAELGLELKNVIKAMESFKIGEHRIELVLEKDGIQYINDSKSTNPHSLIAALNAVGSSRNVCLIVGGLDKDMDFSLVLQKKDKIKKVFIIGKCKNKLENIFQHVLNYSKYDSIDDAINDACNFAQKGDVVLLSPGCASMDSFKNYIERGNYFKNFILRRVLGE